MLIFQVEAETIWFFRYVVDEIFMYFSDYQTTFYSFQNQVVERKQKYKYT